MRRLVTATGILVLLGALPLPLARAGSGCPCASNSPVINSFPLKWFRWGTSRVLRGTPACDIRGIDNPQIAISKVEPSDSKDGIVQGYQLIVIDRDTNRRRCKGTELLGIEFILSGGKESTVIQQIARTKVEQDTLDLNKTPRPEEHRLVYLIAENARPNDSLCTHKLHRDNWLSRHLRRPFGYREINFSVPQPSPTLDDLFKVLPDHLADYAVIIPDAEHEDNGDLTTPVSPWPPLKIPDSYDANGTPQFSAPSGGTPGSSTSSKASLEWFEYACAGGALAHTDLSGLVDANDPRAIRTAALRMFSGRYRPDRVDTLFGIPLAFRRDIPRSSGSPSPLRSQPPALPPEGLGPVEARWGRDGAVCMSHSRLWMKDTLITAENDTTKGVVERERAFRNRFGVPPCEATRTEVSQDCVELPVPTSGPPVPGATPAATRTTKVCAPYFTSYTMNHIAEPSAPLRASSP